MIKNYNNKPCPYQHLKCNTMLSDKNNTIASLFEVGYFLTNLKQVVKGIKIYKLLKW